MAALRSDNHREYGAEISGGAGDLTLEHGHRRPALVWQRVKGAVYRICYIVSLSPAT